MSYPINFRGKAWAYAETEQLRELAAAKLSARLIADRLPGRTRNSVIGQCTRLGIPLLGPRRGGGWPRKPKLASEINQDWEAAMLETANSTLGSVEPTPSPAEPAPPQPPTAASVTLMELGPHQCRWPLDGGFYCGAEKVRGSYCAEHGARAHNRVAATPEERNAAIEAARLSGRLRRLG